MTEQCAVSDLVTTVALKNNRGSISPALQKIIYNFFYFFSIQLGHSSFDICISYLRVV